MSLIKGLFDYASFWYLGLSQLLRNRLQTIQNKIIRFVLKMCPQSHIGQGVFKTVGWLPVSKRVDQIIFNHVLKIKSDLSPVYKIEQFVPASSVHTYSKFVGVQIQKFLLPIKELQPGISLLNCLGKMVAFSPKNLKLLVRSFFCI